MRHRTLLFLARTPSAYGHSQWLVGGAWNGSSFGLLMAMGLVLIGMGIAHFIGGK